jgi:hypothetical protein
MHFPYRYDHRLAPFWRPFLVRMRRDGVDLTDDGRFVARFGPLRVDTPITNVDGAHVTGPYRWWTAPGARLSFTDDGLTFGTNAERGVCVHFVERVRGFGPRRHSALTVTVEDVDGLVAALERGISSTDAP